MISNMICVSIRISASCVCSGSVWEGTVWPAAEGAGAGDQAERAPDGSAGEGPAAQGAGQLALPLLDWGAGGLCSLASHTSCLSGLSCWRTQSRAACWRNCMWKMLNWWPHCKSQKSGRKMQRRRTSSWRGRSAPSTSCWEMLFMWPLLRDAATLAQRLELLA